MFSISSLLTFFLDCSLLLFVVVVLLLFFVFVCSVERPDIRIESASATHGDMIRRLYGAQSIDFFVAGRVPGVPVVAALTSVINGNKDIVSFPLAASAVVPIYNLPSLDRNIPLLLSRQVSELQQQLETNSEKYKQDPTTMSSDDERIILSVSSWH